MSVAGTGAGFRLDLSLDGGRVGSAEVGIGYSHRGFEKEAEARGWPSAIPYAERLNYRSPGINAVALCNAVESLAGTRVPRRARWMRMLACEAWRICDHVQVTAECFRILGLPGGASRLGRARERMICWIESAFGSRLAGSTICIGGFSRDLPVDAIGALRGVLSASAEAVADATHTVEGDRIIERRLRGLGAISEDAALAFGITGPCLRATGFRMDVRRAQPYLNYDEVEWDMPLGSCGDAYDRMLVRLWEAEESRRIMEQAAEALEPGAIVAEERGSVLPPPHEVYGQTEAAIRYFKVLIDGIGVPRGEIYSCVEAAVGELGFYLVSDGGARPYRLRARSPSFPICRAVPDIITGCAAEDVPITIAGLGIAAGELDR